jgi:YVTN family beta-propeller protein
VPESKERSLRGCTWWLAVAALMCTRAVQGANAPLTIEAKIPLGAVTGRIDHLAFDSSRGRVYVAELGNNTVGIVDVKNRRVLRTVEGFDEPQGIAWEPVTDTVYVASGGDGSLKLFGGADFNALATIALGADADNVRIDRAAHRVYVGYGDGALAIIDPAARRRLADIPLEGHPESFQLDPAGDHIFVNVPDAREIAVVSRKEKRQLASWQTGTLRSNYPMAIDAQDGRVLSVFRQPARLQAHEVRTGRVASTAEVCSDADDVFVDAKRRLIYVICGAGRVDVLKPMGEAYQPIGRVATSRGSRTGLFVPELDRLIVAIRATDREGAALWLLRPTSPAQEAQ